MLINQTELLNSILKCIDDMKLIPASAFPNIDLYMDQVTTFMDEHLKSEKRFPDDKILTKTMINNYAKNRLLPAPVKKKYSKEHMLVLLYIYYFKGFLSLSDIQSLLKPLSERFFQAEDGINIEQIYRDAVDMSDAEAAYIREDIIHKYQTVCDFYSQNERSTTTSSDDSFLQIFSMISLLSYDVYVKKQIIEHLIDSIK